MPRATAETSPARTSTATPATTDCTTDVTVGSTLTIVETPDSGFVFGGWSGACSGTSRSCTLQMDDDKTATGSFRKPRLTVSVNGNGTVTGGGIACTSGSVQRLQRRRGRRPGRDADRHARLGRLVHELERTAPSTSGATCTVTMSGRQERDRELLGRERSTPTTFPLTRLGDR